MEHHSAGNAGNFMPTVWAALRNCCAKLPFLFKEETLMKSDIEIAQEAKMKPIAEVAASLGLADEEDRKSVV